MVILALSVSLTLFTLCLLLNSHCRRVPAQVICSCNTSDVCAAGLGLSAPGPCGRVGWPFCRLLRLSGCWSPVVVACPLRRPRLDLASRSPDLAVVLAGRFFRRTLNLLWLWLETVLHLSALELLRCLHVERLCTRSAQPCPSLPDLPRASTRSPTESKTSSLRRVSRRPLLAHQSRHGCSRPLLQQWAPVLARRLCCRNVHHTDAPLNQLVGPSHETSLAQCWERSAAQPPSCCPPLLPRVLAAHWLLDFSSHCSPWCWSWRRWAFSQLPPRAQVLRSPLLPSKAAPLASMLSLRTEIGVRRNARHSSAPCELH